MSSKTEKTNGAQVEAPATAQNVFHRETPQADPDRAGYFAQFVDEPEKAVIQIVLNSPAFAAAVHKQFDAVKSTDFKNPAFAAIYGASGVLAAAKREATREAIAGELRDWQNDGNGNRTRADLEAALQFIKSAPEIRVSEKTIAIAKTKAKEIKDRREAENPPINPNEIKREAKEIAREVQAATRPQPDRPPAFEFGFTTDNDLDDRLGEIEWEWPGYIPRGFVTAIVGDQDVGKSQVAQSLCDIRLRGSRWPDGQPHEPHPDTKLLWIDTEGSIALFYQRMKFWGMKRGCFILPPDPLQELTVDDELHWMWIEAAIEKFMPPIIVIDALSGAHKSGKENGNDEMKPVMKKLAGLAQKYNIAVLVVHHLNKPIAGVAPYPITIHRLRGASAIPQYCRSILALGSPDVNQPEKRRLDVIKLNLAKKPAPVGYELSDHGPLWGDAPEPPKERRAIDDALDFLEIALKDGPRLSEDVQGEAKAQKIGSNALRDAMKAMKVKPRREGGKDGRWFWYPPAEVHKGGQE